MRIAERLQDHPSWSELPENAQSLQRDLLSLPGLDRLRRVSFLGAIERFATKSVTGTGGSRYDHTIGVMKLLLALWSPLKLTPGELRIALAHSLLHDIGHGPFSHSSERFFMETFELNHHIALLRTIEHAHSAVSKTLRRHGVWHDYRRFIERPTAHPVVHDLFYGPINIDTIEGIFRAAAFFRVKTSIDTKILAAALCRRPLPVAPFDEFWSLKNKVYNEHIFSEQHAAADDRLTSILRQNRSKVCVEDFALTDSELEAKFEHSFESAGSISADTTAPKARRRSFVIKRNISPAKPLALKARYTDDRGVDGKH